MSDALSELEAQVNEAFTTAMSNHEAVHAFQAVADAVFQLGAEPVAKALKAQFPWYSGMNPINGLYVDRDELDLAAIEAEHSLLTDKLADLAREGHELLRVWLAQHGLTRVVLSVYMICHQGFSPVLFMASGAD